MSRIQSIRRLAGVVAVLATAVLAAALTAPAALAVQVPPPGGADRGRRRGGRGGAGGACRPGSPGPPPAGHHGDRTSTNQGGLTSTGQPGPDVAATGEHLIEYRRELAVAVADQEFEVAG